MAKGRSRGDAVADREGVTLEGGEDFLPGFAPVDVGAVGEMPPVRESASRPCASFMGHRGQRW
jgi:hypothetical protein